MSPQLESMFDEFWDVYPRKTAKIAARKAWTKLAPTEQEASAIVSGVVRYSYSGLWQQPQYIPHPATFLNGRRWEDELHIGSNGGVLTPQPRYCSVCGHTGSWHLNEVKHGRTVGHEFVLASDTQDVAQPSGAIAQGRF